MSSRQAASPGVGCVLHIDSGTSFRGGQRQLLLLSEAQHGDGEGPQPRLLARDPQLLAGARRAGVAAQKWQGPTNPVGLLQLHAVLRAARGGLIHVHDSRSLGAVRLLATDAAQQRLVVHRRIDDPPRSRALTRWKYQRGRFICVSHAVAEVLGTFGIPRDRLHVVHSTLPARADAPPPGRSKAGQGPLHLLAIGALVPHKGHRSLLDALAIARHEIVLRVAGQGPLRPALLARSRALGIDDRVSFVGDRVDLEEELRSCDLLVHPSLSEGLGTAVLDAMWAARPVLASCAGGLPELVNDPQTGWLVAPGDVPALAALVDEIADLKGRDPEALHARGIAGWERARDRFRIADMVRATREVYDVCP
jgi:glycosyltransferase involved in cell wall biosynthesis